MKICVLFALIITVLSKCPDPSELTRSSDGRSVCARVFDLSHKADVQSCGGNNRDIIVDETTILTKNLKEWDDKVSSLVVRTGCKMQLFENPDFEGGDDTFTGVVPRLSDVRTRESGPTTGDWDNHASAWSCGCDFGPVDCTSATAAWVHLLSCDTSQVKPGQTAGSCSLNMQIGMSIGSATSRGHQLSASAQLSIGAEVLAGLNLNLGSTFTKSVQETQNFGSSNSTAVSIKANNIPGKVTKIYQYQGSCGGSSYKTINYRVIYEDKVFVDKKIEAPPRFGKTTELKAGPDLKHVKYCGIALQDGARIYGPNKAAADVKHYIYSTDHGKSARVSCPGGEQILIDTQEGYEGTQKIGPFRTDVHIRSSSLELQCICNGTLVQNSKCYFTVPWTFDFQMQMTLITPTEAEYRKRGCLNHCPSGIAVPRGVYRVRCVSAKTLIDMKLDDWIIVE